MTILIVIQFILRKKMDCGSLYLQFAQMNFISISYGPHLSQNRRLNYKSFMARLFYLNN